MIFAFIVIIPVVLAKQMTLCEYFKRLAVDVPVCRPYSPTHYNSYKKYGTGYDDPISNSGISSPAFPLCRTNFHSCMSSSVCESGTVCVSDITSTPCCTNPVQKMCPHPSALNIQCRKLRAVNWCSTDYDCHGPSTMPAKCCPTGCNYNMCVHIGVPQSHPLIRRQIVFSSLTGNDVCPDPYTLAITCTARRATSWCLTDAECPSVNSLHPRKCCPTLCGYNACLVKYNGKWMVG